MPNSMVLIGRVVISKFIIGQFPPAEVFMQYVIEGIVDLFTVLGRIETKLEDILSDQDTLNGYVARILAANENIQSELAALKAQPGAAALDFSGLDAAVVGEEGLESVASTPPVVTPPADGSTTPPADGSADAATTATVTAS